MHSLRDSPKQAAVSGSGDAADHSACRVASRSLFWEVHINHDARDLARPEPFATGSRVREQMIGFLGDHVPYEEGGRRCDAHRFGGARGRGKCAVTDCSTVAGMTSARGKRRHCALSRCGRKDDQKGLPWMFSMFCTCGGNCAAIL